jgi:hypothetical protein
MNEKPQNKNKNISPDLAKNQPTQSPERLKKIVQKITEHPNFNNHVLSSLNFINDNPGVLTPIKKDLLTK